MSLATRALKDKDKREKVLRGGLPAMGGGCRASSARARKGHSSPVLGLAGAGWAHAGIIGASPAMRAVFHLINRVGPTAATVLITGESGTGKELVARAVHNATPGGCRRPFIALNCSAIPGALLESELFGHERGAFTGASARKTGKVELAHGGTLFLDEVATMPLNLQVKLLRFLQEREFTRIGGTTIIRTDLRIIAAANVNLQEAVKRGDFREDLFYRLNVVPICLPPLRERGADMTLLARHFLSMYADKYSRPLPLLTPEAQAALRRYAWPGNVRELENIMERIVVLAVEGRPVDTGDLPEEVLSGAGEPASGRALLLDEGHASGMRECIDATPGYRAALRSFERRYITTILEQTNWNRSETARIMKIHRNTLLQKMKVLGIK